MQRKAERWVEPLVLLTRDGWRPTKTPARFTLVAPDGARSWCKALHVPWLLSKGCPDDVCSDMVEAGAKVAKL